MPLLSVISDSVDVTRSPSTTTLYTADRLVLSCVTMVHQAVDVSVVVTHQWIGPGGVVSSSSGVSVSGVTRSGHTYTSTITFNSLLSSHSGTYTCSSTVSPVGSPVFVASEAVKTSSTSFSAGISLCSYCELEFMINCVAIRVIVEITRSPSDDYPHYSPSNYRTASSVTMRCVASGTTGYVRYRWSSTCSSCFAYSSSSQTISKNCLISTDAGVHTCSVTDGVGNSGSNATTMRIVGELGLILVATITMSA